MATPCRDLTLFFEIRWVDLSFGKNLELNLHNYIVLWPASDARSTPPLQARQREKAQAEEKRRIQEEVRKTQIDNHGDQTLISQIFLLFKRNQVCLLDF